MYDYNDMAMMWGVIAMFYIGFFVIYWILVGIINHALLNKKGYRHVGLYVLAWFPILNWFIVFLTVGLPDALMHRKMDYLLRQLAASGHIAGPEGMQAMPGTQPQSPTPGSYQPQVTPQPQPGNPFGPQANASYQPQGQTTNPSQLFGPQSNPSGGQYTPPSSGNSI